MKLLWDKLLVENQVIMQLQYSVIPKNVYYLFPTLEQANKFIQTSQNDKSIVQGSIKIKKINEIFT